MIGWVTALDIVSLTAIRKTEKGKFSVENTFSNPNGA
jgi:hypothetical protein